MAAASCWPGLCIRIKAEASILGAWSRMPRRIHGSSVSGPVPELPFAGFMEMLATIVTSFETSLMRYWRRYGKNRPRTLVLS